MPDDNNPWRDVDVARAGMSTRRGFGREYGLPGGSCLSCSMVIAAMLASVAALALVLL